jgi:hypothetical protein
MREINQALTDLPLLALEFAGLLGETQPFVGLLLPAGCQPGTPAALEDPR